MAETVARAALSLLQADEARPKRPRVDDAEATAAPPSEWWLAALRDDAVSVVRVDDARALGVLATELARSDMDAAALKATLSDPQKTVQAFIDHIALPRLAAGRGRRFSELGAVVGSAVLASAGSQAASETVPLDRASLDDNEGGLATRNGGATRNGEPQGPEAQTAQHQVEFLRLALQLKKEKRTGWVLREIEEAESVADHSFGVGLCAMLVRSDGLDWQKACLMGLVHDLAEAIVGDLVPGQVSAADKHQQETQAMERLIHGKLAGSPAARSIEALWQEYEARASPEARLVKDLDRFEMILQADTYERADSSRDLTEFFTGVRGKLENPQVAAWQRALERDRDARRAAASS